MKPRSIDSQEIHYYVVHVRPRLDNFHLLDFGVKPVASGVLGYHRNIQSLTGMGHVQPIYIKLPSYQGVQAVTSYNKLSWPCASLL